MPLFTVRFHKFWYFFFSKNSSAENVDILRSNIVCNDSTKNDTGRPIVFNSFFGNSETFANASSTVYPKWNGSALLLVKHVLQISRLDFSSSRRVPNFETRGRTNEARKESLSIRLRCKRASRQQQPKTFSEMVLLYHALLQICR